MCCDRDSSFVPAVCVAVGGTCRDLKVVFFHKCFRSRGKAPLLEKREKWGTQSALKLLTSETKVYCSLLLLHPAFRQVFP